MNAEAEVRRAVPGHPDRVEGPGAIGQDGRGGDDPLEMGLADSGRHARGLAVVVGVDDQAAPHGVRMSRRAGMHS